MKAAKTASFLGAILGLIVAVVWLGVFFGTSPNSPHAEMLACQIVFVVWLALLAGGTSGFVLFSVLEVRGINRRP